MTVRGSAAKPGISTALAAVLVALPCLLFYALLAWQHSAAPVQDDYSALLDFALRWHGAASLHQHAVLFLTAQDGDYKLYLDHACVVACLWLLHRVSVLGLCWLGNLLWLAVAALLYQTTSRPGIPLVERLLIFLPASALLFQLNSAETFDWAMAGLQNVGVIAFALAAIAAVQRTGMRWAVASFALCLAALCASANGFLLLPIALCLLLRSQPVRALLLTLLFTAAGVAYRWRLHLAPKRLSSPPQDATFALNFLGGAVESIRGKPFHGAALLLGLAMLLALAWLVRNGMRGRNPFLFWVAVWICLTTALVVVGRAGGPQELARSGRYKIYSDLLLAVLYLDAASLIALRKHRRAAAYFFAVAVTCVMCAVSDVQGVLFLGTRRIAAEEQCVRYLGLTPGTPSAGVEASEQAPSALRDRYLRDVLVGSVMSGLYRQPQLCVRKAL